MDISEKMLDIGKAKVAQQMMENQIELGLGDAASLPFEGDSFDAVTVAPFEGDSFDAVTVAFGVRNFENLDKSLSEIHRVLKQDGLIVILEFSMPERFPVKQLYRFYFKRVLPKIGRRLSKDPGAYTYLPESVEHFPKPDDFIQLLLEKGLENGTKRPLSFGIATLYKAEKR